MRKTDVTQHSLYSYRTLEERIPDAHPLRKLRVLVDAILVNMNYDVNQRRKLSTSQRPILSTFEGR